MAAIPVAVGLRYGCVGMSTVRRGWDAFGEVGVNELQFVAVGAAAQWFERQKVQVEWRERSREANSAPGLARVANKQAQRGWEQGEEVTFACK